MSVRAERFAIFETVLNVLLMGTLAAVLLTLYFDPSPTPGATTECEAFEMWTPAVPCPTDPNRTCTGVSQSRTLTCTVTDSPGSGPPFVEVPDIPPGHALLFCIRAVKGGSLPRAQA